MRLLNGAEGLYWNELVLAPKFLDENFLPDDQPCLTWTDENSNYAGAFQNGPLEGWVFFLDHEETMTVPRFRDDHAFRSWQAKISDADFLNTPTDYPRLEAAVTDSEDLALAQHYRRIWCNGGPGSRIAAWRSLALLPVDSTSTAVEFLQSDDPWVQEAAVKLLGERRFLAAADSLMKVALQGSHNGRLAALVAFRNWGAAGASYLRELKPQLPATYWGYFRNLE